MIAKLFVPHIIKDQVYHFQIGYQHIIIIENKRYINQIIVNKQIAKVFMSFSNFSTSKILSAMSSNSL